MALAPPSHYNPNFMLDLECISVNAPNPVLLELGFVHFDLDTGAELGKLKLPINLQSCLDRGLVMDDDTARWVQREIPNTLATSKSTKVTLDNALDAVSAYINSIVNMTRKSNIARGFDSKLSEKYSEPRIWGNGAVADNVWLRSAYVACGKKRPWKFTGDMCVRTFVTQAGLLTGRNFPGEVQRQGRHHDALDDCRHQIRYLVRARQALISRQENIIGTDPPIATEGIKLNSEHSKTRPESLRQQSQAFAPTAAAAETVLEPGTSVETVSGSTLLDHSRESGSSTIQEEQSRPRPTPSNPPSTKEAEVGNSKDTLACLSSPELIMDMPDGSKKLFQLQGGRYSFVDTNDNIRDSAREELSNSPQKRKRVASGSAALQRPGMIPTPETSFGGIGEEAGDIASLDSDPGDGYEVQESSTGISQTIEGMAIVTPETSFSRLEEEFGVDDTSRSPSPEPQRLMLDLV